MKEAIVDKIRKLMALANNNSSVHEAANAAARAQELLLEHKLSLSEISVETDEPEGIETVTYNTDGRRHITWEGNLLYGITKSNFCRLIESWRDGKASYKIVGKKSDSDTVLYLYEYLTKEVKRLSAEAGIAYKNSYEGYAPGKGWHNSFKLGAVSTINARLYEAQQVATSSSERALVVVQSSDSALKAYIAVTFPNLRKASGGAGVSNGNAYRAGITAATNIGLPGKNKGLGAAPKMLP